MKYVPPAKKHENPLYEINEKLIPHCPAFFLGDQAFRVHVAYCPESLVSCWLFEFYKVFRIMAYSCEMFEDTFRIADLRNPCGVINFDANGPKIIVPGEARKSEANLKQI